MRSIALIFATALCAFAFSVRAESLDRRAKDSVGLFDLGCVSPGGSKERFILVFEALRQTPGLKELFKQLPTDAVQKLQLGRPNGIGFVTNSPGGAQLIVDFEDRGICGVRVKEADETSVQKYFEALVQTMARKLSATVEPQSGSVTQLEGHRKTFKAWLITPADGRSVLLALTTLDRPGALQQHFMTLSH
jgi:hypothetical protein